MAKTFGIWSVLGALVALGSVTGCGPGPDDWQPVGDGYEYNTPTPGPLGGQLFQGTVTRSGGKAAPIAGGTLLVTRDGHALAADPDRDQVYVVDLVEQKVQPVALEAGDEPGRVVEGKAGTAYVAARRGGVVLEIDVASASVTRIPVCAAPRGLAFDSETAQLFVACRSGVLAVVDSKTRKVSERFRLDADLRDVTLSGDKLVVTRFKSAEVLVVNRAGELLGRKKPVPANNGISVTPSVAYRTLSAPGGGVLVGHINSSNTQLPSGAGAYYGSPCGGSVADMSLSVMDPNDTPEGKPALTTVVSQALGGMAGPLDLAYSRDGAQLAILATGNSWSPDGNARPTLFLSSSTSTSGPLGALPNNCGGATGQPNTIMAKGEPVAVAFDQNNSWVVQSRQPAQLELQGGAVISLADDNRFDTGLAMFHMNTGGGISCTSCHPEAGEDGHVWNFTAGMRRSQELKGGVSTRAPFHWTGDLTTFDALFNEVMIKRMSLLQVVSPEQRLALQDWLDAVPAERTADDLDPDAIERGKVLFEDKQVACATCHLGPDFTDNLPHDVGTGTSFITPSLLGVNTRAPLFHDGCAESLTGRFGPCGGYDKHGVTSQLTDDNRADLVTYMQSL